MESYPKGGGLLLEAGGGGGGGGMVHGENGTLSVWCSRACIKAGGGNLSDENDTDRPLSESRLM